MNKKIKIGIVAIILLVSSIIAVSAIRQPNDYIAVLTPFNDFKMSPTSDDVLDVSFNVAYIPLTGSATYTLTVSPVTANINMTQKAQIMPTIKTAVTSQAVSKGYNLKWIIYPAYNMDKVI